MRLPLLAGALLLSASAIAAPKADPWPRWQAHDATSKASIDHSAWNAILERYVLTESQPYRFAYSSVSTDDRRALNRYVDALAATAVSTFGRAEQQAYWINLYNALTIRLILDHYPVRSIRSINISPGLFSRGPWDKKLVVVEGQGLTLNDIEHRILRPLWQDPRIHYAVNCASLGCPNLQPRAYTANRLNDLLDLAARQFINDPRGASVRDNRLVVSSIYDWFKADFGDTDAAVIEHLRQYAAPELVQQLQAVERISDDQYDWSLNDAAGQ